MIAPSDPRDPTAGAQSAERQADPGGGEEDPGPVLGWRSQEVAEELPQLQLAVSECEVTRAGVRVGQSPRPVKERLRMLANRFNGARAINLRREPIPAAYRVFYRHIGLDPDIVPTPVEQAVISRMVKGGIASAGLVADVLLITLLDTGVPIWALDSDTLDGPLGIRLVGGAGEPLGRFAQAPQLAPGGLVIADYSTALALLFGALAPGHEAGSRCTRVTLFSLQIEGVPWLHLEEALWMASTMLATTRR
jgi:DNA/RNA-binding domain of Phe-tRNA-synthetase-like protein